MDVEALLGQMTLEEKVGQMFMLAFAGRRLDEARLLLQENGIGGCYIGQDNAATPAEAVELTRTLQGYAAATRLRIPLLLGVDQEGAWGVIVPHGCTGPGNMALGAGNSSVQTRRMYEVIGREMAAVGYNTLLAPCVDINSNPRNPIIGTRSFGEVPAAVARHAAAAVEGARTGGVITTAKHFPGHGDTAADSHRDLARVDRGRAELDAVDLLPFRAAVAAGVDIVMTAHIFYPAIDATYPATLSQAILHGLLRREMGFNGVILTDSMNMGAMRHHYPPAESAVLAVLAGADVIMLAEEHYDHDAATYLEKQLECVRGVLEGARSGRIPGDRIDDAVRRVLALKAKQDLFAENAGASPLALEIVGRVEHRVVELEAARAAVAVLRNEHGLLPLPAGSRPVLVNATPRSSYAILTATRGIGPNQSDAAFDVFADHICAQRRGVEVLPYEELSPAEDLPESLRQADVVLVVTESYPLPGMDFSTDAQTRLVRRLLSELGRRLVVVGLRDPYDLAAFPEAGSYLCSFSSRLCAARAAAEVVLGAVPATGKLPVSVPGVAAAVV